MCAKILAVIVLILLAWLPIFYRMGYIKGQCAAKKKTDTAEPDVFVGRFYHGQ